MHKIELFVPYRYIKKPIDKEIVDKLFGSETLYASKGRYAIIHILYSYGIRDGKVGISSYMCPTVREELINRGFDVVYYDVDLGDLNPSVDSINSLIVKEKPKAVIVASLYGNPANLIDIELVCKKHKTIMIDDAAQAFGAKIGNKYVGSFGDGGFFSFSPGKPTAAHRGSFFWTSKKYDIKRNRHPLNALISYKLFKYKRYLAYENHYFLKMFWTILEVLISMISCDLLYDKPERFEYKILGGVIQMNLNEAYKYRKYYFGLISSLQVPCSCRQICALRGEPNNCKIVYIFNERKDKDDFATYLDDKSIRYFGGYSVPDLAENCVNAYSIANKIIELPIDPFEEKMDYLYSCINEYFCETKG